MTGSLSISLRARTAAAWSGLGSANQPKRRVRARHSSTKGRKQSRLPSLRPPMRVIGLSLCAFAGMARKDVNRAERAPIDGRVLPRPRALL